MIRTEPKFAKKSASGIVFSSLTKLFGLSEYESLTASAFMEDGISRGYIENFKVVSPVPEQIKHLVFKESGTEYKAVTGGFVIVRENDDVFVFADDDEGRQNGVVTFLASLSNDGELNDEIIYDYPVCPLRGVKILMPAEGELDEFKRFVDTMAFFRHNTLMIEIGGAMEYERHPEINEGWVEYCAFMSEYSGKTIDLQERTFPWRKNSIHCNNGGGSFLSKKTVGELIEYCKSRNVSIIPEIPSTSHCDYMLTRHPEIAERCEDPYPDTFCPSNPDSYKLLFDIFDEVIELFRPEIINIGHDEYYSINICDRCRKRLMTNAEILAEDINKIHDYLAEHGVKTMLWCDKLMNVERDEGYGGALTYIYFEWDPSKDLLAILRPTWEARNMIPKDVICLNWYTGFGEEYDSQLREFPVVFGNFKGQFSFRNFKRRIGDNTSGAICSNWGAATDIYFKRNNVLAAVAYNEIYYWDSEYDDNSGVEYPDRIDRVFKALFTYRHKKDMKELIEITHSTDMSVPYREFVDGVFPEGEEFRNKYLVGQYLISYDDGTEHTADIFYGEHIASDSTPSYRAGTEKKAEKVDGDPGVERVRLDLTLSSLAGEVIPTFEDGKLVCKTYIKNPFPQKKIAKVSFVERTDREHTVTVYGVKIYPFSKE